MPKLWLWLVTSQILGCSNPAPDHKNQTPIELGDAIPAPSSHGVLFTAIEGVPNTSVLYFFDYRTETLSVLEDGLSSDPLVQRLGPTYWVFQRGSAKQHVRQWAWDGQSMAPQSPQYQLQHLVPGDPHDAIPFDANAALVANFNGGNLSILRPSDKDMVVEEVTLTTAAHHPKPEYLLADGDDRVFVLHQGFSPDYQLTHDQSLLTLQVEKTDDIPNTVRQIDALPDTPELNGIPLKVTVPNLMFRNSAGELIVMGMCARFVATMHSCVQGFERVDVEKGQTELIWQLPNDTYMNGASFAFDDDRVFANVETGPQDAPQQVVMAYDLAGKKSSVIHTHPTDSGGYYALVYDPIADLLFVGERTPDIQGRLVIYKGNGEQVYGSAPLPFIPYNGVVVGGQ